MAFFVAFYSYKGGVGRTLALANVAYALAQRGKRVVLVDMDLEAPTLLGIPVFKLKTKAPKKGFLEYAAAYRKRGNCPPIKGYVHLCRQSPGSGQLWVMPSGKVDSSYKKTLGNLPWTCLHPHKGTPPLVEGLRKALIEELDPHYVLIDSRTGLSDIGGLSTHLLADMVVLVFNLTRECIEGSIRAYRSFNPETTNVRAIQLVASPIPPTASSGDSVVEERLRQAKEHMPQGIMHDGGVIRILYDPGMVLSETLAVLEPEIYAAAEKYHRLREEVQRRNEDDIFSVLEAARQSRAYGRWEQGRKQLEAFVEKHPEDLEGFMELGTFFLDAGRATQASNCFEKATKLAKGMPAAYRKLGEALLAIGELDGAIRSLERARDLGDESLQALEALAAAYAKRAGPGTETDDTSRQIELRQKASRAKREALSTLLANFEQVTLSPTQDLHDLRDEFITTLRARLPYGDFSAARTWEHLSASEELTPAERYTVAKAVLSGKLTSSQTSDLSRLLPGVTRRRGQGLEIRISSEYAAGATILRYVLHSPNGQSNYNHYEVQGRTKILGTPLEYQARVLATIEHPGQDRGSEGSLVGDDVENEFQAVGRKLYHDLFPEELRVAYRDFRETVQSLLIVTDEPWIPWELIKPFGEGFEDDFLCCRFELTRWLAGKTAPLEIGAVELGAARVVSFEAGRVLDVEQLPHAAEESLLLAEMAGRYSGVESLIVADATYEEVEKVLRLGGNGILHFVGHGETEAKEPDVSRFLLADGRSFRPRDLLHPGIEAQIRQDRPLVFFNTCQPRQGYALTGLGNWASRWIVDCGCGAFVGPQWSVRDRSAYLFAKVFYGALERGETVAQATLKARLEVRDQDPGSSAWLAYTVYAYPNARLRLGLGPVPLRVPMSRWRAGISPPGALLRAEYGIVPFHGRDDELANLLEWSGGDDPVGVRLYTGAGGMGKTRLALELCRQLSEQGWQAGFLAPDPSRSPAEMWRDLRARSKPSLIVVDYAETRRELLVPLLKEMHQAEEGKIRMLLLARAALDWWEQLKNESEGVGELLSGPATRWFALTPLAMTVEGREASYRQASYAFARLLGKPQPQATPERLDAEYYERVLLLHMRALADIEGVPVKDEDGILDSILHRERRFWGRLAEERELSKDLADGIGRAMGMITLGGGIDSEDHAVAAIGALKLFNDQDRSVLVQVARLLHESYPGARWIEPILPDLLGEHLIQREMEKGADELLDLVLGPKPTDL